MANYVCMYVVICFDTVFFQMKTNEGMNALVAKTKKKLNTNSKF